MQDKPNRLLADSRCDKEVINHHEVSSGMTAKTQAANHWFYILSWHTNHVCSISNRVCWHHICTVTRMTVHNCQCEQLTFMVCHGKVTKNILEWKQVQVGMEPSKTNEGMTPLYFHTIPTSFAILSLCLVFVIVVCIGGLWKPLEWVVHVDVHGQWVVGGCSLIVTFNWNLLPLQTTLAQLCGVSNCWTGIWNGK